MSHSPILNHHDLGAYIAGAAVVNYIVSLISHQEAFLQGVASIATAVAAVVSIYFAIRNRKR